MRDEVVLRGADGMDLSLKLTLRPYESLHIIEERAGASLDVEIGEGAHLQYTRLLLGDAGTKKSSLRAVVQSGGSLLCRTAVALPAFEMDCCIVLQGKGAFATLYSLSLLSPSQTFCQTLFIDHRAPNTSSSQLVKGLAADGAFGFVESRVRVNKEAVASSSRQHSRFLTLGTAKTVHKPQFEIFTDDVMAVHGATTGMLDDDALFYLRSRGLTVQEARRHLVEGFCDEIIREMPQEAVPMLRQRVDEMIGATFQ